ncbi:hypothetical protein [Streptomyces sp. NPDC059209]|uniref:hypothetical protein n=1 Tax=Streptomyces sp. NPDC059209 TaxID=3346769 RepID=UPI00369B2EE0
MTTRVVDGMSGTNSSRARMTPKMMPSTLAREYLGPASFGHDGAGGQVAFADVTHRVGFAFLTNLMEAGADHRATSIVDELRRLLRRSSRP